MTSLPCNGSFRRLTRVSSYYKKFSFPHCLILIIFKMSIDESSDSVQYKKKKKKRSFIQEQKRFGRKGNYGRGTQLTQDMYDYFIDIMKVLNTKKDDEEEMSKFINMVFSSFIWFFFIIIKLIMPP